jgi:hypothetical protein
MSATRRSLAPFLGAIGVALAAPAWSQAPISDADALRLVADQEAAWNAGQLDRYFATFTPDATFTDQAYVGDKPPVPYGTAKLAEARANARRAFLRKPWPSEAARVLRIERPADGSVRVVAAVGSTIREDARLRRFCASRVLVLVRTGGALRARSRTDTFVRCRG